MNCKEPKGTFKYTIIEKMVNGDHYFLIQCHYMRKKYFLFGEMIEATDFIRNEDRCVIKSYTLSCTQSIISGLNTPDSTKVIKEINKPNR